ncbi:TolB amino-terminal domain-containing protein [Parasphingorhabdus marina DSM 22363]|uniref:TolB amino-terminal domain-containing protein n=1 Tax=Parasphingorhabdus marina DSM 22363 TaxID=1123272 RepID=A0A1N6HUC9_9SPHN|nr:winged helix-turn-helix domain-containing protein [Parasphingorhabdus marina]SIO23265.1 TolB amino-terminal domain-containing protein [Parasphingorhabdus marina DSM 22363]
MIYRFEDFELNTKLQELFRNGVPVQMQPQVYALLELLLSHHDRVVSKDEINAGVWNGRIVSEAVVNSRIRSVRLAVSDNGKEQRLIKTMHNRGFRFVGNPVVINPDSADARDGLQTIGKTGPSASLAVSAPDHRLDAEPLKTGGGGHAAIAILPFKNMSDDPEHSFFADGICEDIITALTKVPRLFVIGRLARADDPEGQAATDSNGPDLSDIQALGRELDVQHVLDGSVRRFNDRFRISVQLIDAITGDHVWAEKYDREMRDIFELQDEMTREIITALQVQLTDGDDARLWSEGTNSYEAWEAVLKARELCLTHRQANVLEGRQHAQRAVELDSRYAGAWSWIGYSWWSEALGGWSGNQTFALNAAREAAQQGLEIDPENAGIVGLLSLILVSLRQFEEADRMANQAIEKGPNNNYALGCAGAVKMYRNDLDTAEILLRKAMRMAPLYKAGNPEVLGAILLFQRRYEEAIAAAHECLGLDPEYFFAHCTLAVIHAELGQPDKSREAGRNILRINPDFAVQTFAMRQPFEHPEMLNRCLSGLRVAGIPENAPISG